MAAHAFLIANDVFDDEQIQPLRYPKNDIARLGEVLTNKSIADFKVKPIYNKRHFEVPHEIATDLEAVARDDTLLVYYAGHGLLGRNGNLYLATQDTRKKHVATTAISVNGLLDLMQESNCKKRILVLDCCHSGAAGSGVELRGAVDSTLGAASKSHGTYILTASTGLQTAAEREEDGHGLLTKHLIEGLESGNAARPGSLAITADDLYTYVHARVVGSGSQEPLRWALGVGGDIILANANAKHVEERRETARKRFEQHLRDGLIQSSVYGNVVGVLVSTETSERIHDLRRRIFDYVDGRIPYTALGAELLGTPPQPDSAQPLPGKRLSEKPAEQAQTSRSADTRQGNDRQADAAASVAIKPRAKSSWAAWITLRFGVIFWLFASYMLATFLNDAVGLTSASVLVPAAISNIAVSVLVLMIALGRRGALRWFLFLQCLVSIGLALFVMTTRI